MGPQEVTALLEKKLLLKKKAKHFAIFILVFLTIVFTVIGEIPVFLLPLNETWQVTLFFGWPAFCITTAILLYFTAKQILGMYSLYRQLKQPSPQSYQQTTSSWNIYEEAHA
jgi:hypothetical protein